jgi:hypothetical protein
MNYLLRLNPSGIQIRGMAHPQSLRHPLFRRRWFADDFIITWVQWYLRFKLSYRDLAELARELGVSVAQSTILLPLRHPEEHFRPPCAGIRSATSVR